MRWGKKKAQKEESKEESFTGEMNVTDATGHTTVRWNKSDPKSVAEARVKFDSALTQGPRIAFRTKPTQAKISSFDPNAEEIVLVGQYVGG